MIVSHLPTLHRFVVQLYGITDKNIESVDEARVYQFFHKRKDFKQMPPSSDALF